VRASTYPIITSVPVGKVLDGMSGVRQSGSWTGRVPAPWSHDHGLAGETTSPRSG